MKRSNPITLLLLGALLLSGCSTQAAQAPSGAETSTPPAAAAQGSAEQTTTSSADIIQKAFGVSVANVTPEVSDADGIQQERYTLDGARVVIARTDSGIPDFLYYFKDDASKEEPETYDYPDTIATDAQAFLSQVLGVKANPDAIGIYGYQNRIGVLLVASDGSCFHVQFMPEDNAVIGYQHFTDLQSAESFYSKQNAKKLS